MGSFDGVKICKVVGLCILHKLEEQHGKERRADQKRKEQGKDLLNYLRMNSFFQI